MKRPANLIYALEERPPWLVVALNGVQHVGLIAINLVYPVLVFRLAGVPASMLASLLCAGFLVLAIATVLQCKRLGPLGSGYMCPATITATYFSPSLLAVKTGGLSLLFGMTLFAGVLEAALARGLQRMRAILPTEISGLVIFLVGLSGGIAGLRAMLGARAAPVSAAEWWAAGITLGSMIAFNVWGRGLLRMMCAFIGLVAGYVAAALLGLFGAEQWQAVAQTPWLALPEFSHVSWSFDAALALPFAIASVAAAMKTVGTLAVCQRINDADWVRPDLASATRGVLADGAGTAIAGLMGSVGINTSTPSVGLSSATGVTSRVVAYAVAALFGVLALMPKLAMLLAEMPRAVLVAALLFVLCFVLISGLQVMSSRLLDTRRTLVLGSAILGAAAVEALPGIGANAGAGLAPLLGSSLVFGTVLALAMNLVFRIGVGQKALLTLERGATDAQKVEDFFAARGAAWGARSEVIRRAAFGVHQLVEAVVENCWREGPLAIEARFDEFNLDVELTYRGELLEFPLTRPNERDIREDEHALRHLAGFMLRQNADRVRSESKDGRCSVLFHFDH